MMIYGLRLDVLDLSKWNKILRLSIEQLDFGRLFYNKYERN